MYQMCAVFFGALEHPDILKIYGIGDASNGGVTTTPYSNKKWDFGVAYADIAEQDNEWYHFVLSPMARFLVDFDTYIRVLNEQVIEDIHFASTYIDGADADFSDVETNVNDLYEITLGDNASSAAAIGTVKNIAVLGDMNLLFNGGGTSATPDVASSYTVSTEYVATVNSNLTEARSIEDNITRAVNKNLAQGISIALSVREGGTYNPAYISFAPNFIQNKLSSNQVRDILAANGNCYHGINGVSVFEKGRCTGSYVLGAPLGDNNMGEWVDTVIFMDEMKIRLQERLFAALRKASEMKSKVPYTQKGIDFLAGECAVLFDMWQAEGRLATWSPDHKSMQDVTEEDRKARKYTGFMFTCRLAGAINEIGINVLLED